MITMGSEIKISVKIDTNIFFFKHVLIIWVMLNITAERMK